MPGWEVSKLRNELFTNDFGFIVDYVAEVLKNLRKEDHGKLYQQYFELSSTITTRDKTAIEKTFSGLIKIIYPNLKATKQDIKALLDFSIEMRKRVKNQLLKMDETFNDDPVFFEYTDKDGTKYTIETLEEIEYGELDEKDLSTKDENQINIEVREAASVNNLQKNESFRLSGFTKNIRENQCNISYDRLFGHYLENATVFTIQDPYIRLPHQFRNFLELCSLIYEKNKDGENLKIHLITWNEIEYQQNSIDAFDEIRASLEEMNIDFTYELKPSVHDRHITTNNGWKIMLGRGLDIWQKSNGRFDIAEILQEKRKFKEFDVVAMSL